MTSKKRLILSYGILALLLAVLFAANLFWGSVSLTPGAVLAALTGRGQDALSVGIITQLRLPRAVMVVLQGAEPFLRTALCLEVFRERGLLQCCRLGDSISLHLTSQGKKVALDRSEYLLRLHRALDASKGGAR